MVNFRIERCISLLRLESAERYRNWLENLCGTEIAVKDEVTKFAPTALTLPAING